MCRRSKKKNGTIRKLLWIAHFEHESSDEKQIKTKSETLNREALSDYVNDEAEKWNENTFAAMIDVAMSD